MSELHGWGDESIPGAGTMPHAYVLSAVLIAPHEAESVRGQMRGLQLRSESKIHWRDCQPKRRDELVREAAQLPLTGLVAVYDPQSGEKDERRRRKCMQQFFPSLAGLGCTNLVLESRGDAQDTRDMECLAALRSSRILDGSGLRLSHATGPEEPLLWLADLVCGSVGAHMKGQSTWLDTLREAFTVHGLDGL